jgi:hypothetical protein
LLVCYNENTEKKKTQPQVIPGDRFSGFSSLCFLSAQEQDSITFKTQNNLSVTVDVDPYLQLIDGDINELQTSTYLIRRRLEGTLPAQRGSHQPNDNNPFYTLCLDVFDLNGHFLGTRIHNAPVPH